MLISRSIDQSINLLINQFINQSLDLSINQSIIPSINHFHILFFYDLKVGILSVKSKEISFISNDAISNPRRMVTVFVIPRMSDSCLFDPALKW